MDEERRGPGRPRKGEVRERRRRNRETAGILGGRRLGVSADAIDLENFAYRWVNDTGPRLFALTKQDDWAICLQDGGEVKEDATDLSGAISVIVGTKPDGSPMNAYLCRKPRAWYEADMREDQKAVDETEAMLRRGMLATGPGAIQNMDPDMYAVSGNRI